MKENLKQRLVWTAVEVLLVSAAVLIVVQITTRSSALLRSNIQTVADREENHDSKTTLEFKHLNNRLEELASHLKGTAEIDRLRALVTKQMGEIAALKYQVSKYTNTIQTTNQDLTQDGVTNGVVDYLHSDIAVSMRNVFGPELTSTLDEATKAHLNSWINHAFEVDTNGLGKTSYTWPEHWEGYDTEHPRYFYNYEAKRWGVVYEKHDGYQTWIELSIDADGSVHVTETSMDPDNPWMKK